MKEYEERIKKYEVLEKQNQEEITKLKNELKEKDELIK